MTPPADDDERQTLLPPSPDKFGPAKQHSIWQRPARGAHLVRDFIAQNPILICTFCLQFCTYFAKHMVEVPMIKLFEQVICNRYYAAHDELLYPKGQSIEERLCKIPPIQKDLAGLVGLKFTFDALPGQCKPFAYSMMLFIRHIG